MVPKAAEVGLKRGDRAVLEARVRAATSEQRDVTRARIVLLAASGRSTRSIAREVATMPRTVSLWRGRYAREGLVGLIDKPRPGPPPKYSVETNKRVLAVLAARRRAVLRAGRHDGAKLNSRSSRLVHRGDR